MIVKVVTDRERRGPCNPDGLRIFTENGREISEFRSFVYRSSVEDVPRIEIELVGIPFDLNTTSIAKFNGPIIRTILDAIGLDHCEDIEAARNLLKNYRVPLSH